MTTPLFSISGASEILECDRRTIVKALRHVKPDGQDRGQARFRLKTIIDAMQPAVKAKAAGEGGSALSKQRGRLAAAQASKAEFANELAQGCYVDVSVMQTQMITDLMGLRERALSTPGKISDGLTPYTPMDRDRIFQVVKSEIYEMLDDMSDPEAYAARKIAEHVADQKKGKQR